MVQISGPIQSALHPLQWSALQAKENTHYLLNRKLSVSRSATEHLSYTLYEKSDNDENSLVIVFLMVAPSGV